MYRASEQELQDILHVAEALSRHYHKKYPDISTDEFLSIAHQAIGDALQKYRFRKGKLKPRVKKFIYYRFHNFLKKQKPLFFITPKGTSEDTSEAAIIVEEILNTVRLTQKQESAVLYFLECVEPPKENRDAFYNAVRKIRTIYTKSPFLLHMYIKGHRKDGKTKENQI